jgi:hypothetical protein
MAHLPEILEVKDRWAETANTVQFTAPTPAGV